MSLCTGPSSIFNHKIEKLFIYCYIAIQKSDNLKTKKKTLIGTYYKIIRLEVLIYY